MRYITQEEAIKVLTTTPMPRDNNQHRFILRFMFRLNDLAKLKGYRVFSWTDYEIQDAEFAASYILTNIETITRQIVMEKANGKSN